MIQILQEELVVAQGCTEPIAGAYTASVATDMLGEPVEHVKVAASQNIVKNAKGVIIPGTGTLCGIVPSVILGVICGDSNSEMEVLRNVVDADVERTKQLMAEKFCELEIVDSPAKLLIEVTVFGKSGSASIKVVHSHTNIVEKIKNGDVIFSKDYDLFDFSTGDRSHLTVRSAYEFAKEVDFSALDLVRKQIELNDLIANEGSTGAYNLQVFKNVSSSLATAGLDLDVQRLACMRAASGSDARMSGCILPVMTLSGSGNQGIATAVPISTYAKYLGASEEELIRAVCFGDLISIRIKEGIGKLSPLCGAIPATIGAVSGIMFLQGKSVEQVIKLIQNTIANNTGTICDGAKPSCALKIHTGLDAAFLSMNLAVHDVQVTSFTGIVDENIEKTIDNLGGISIAMDKIDDKIIEIMESC